MTKNTQITQLNTNFMDSCKIETLCDFINKFTLPSFSQTNKIILRTFSYLQVEQSE